MHFSSLKFSTFHSVLNHLPITNATFAVIPKIIHASCILVSSAFLFPSFCSSCFSAFRRVRARHTIAPKNRLAREDTARGDAEKSAGRFPRALRVLAQWNDPEENAVILKVYFLCYSIIQRTVSAQQCFCLYGCQSFASVHSASCSCWSRFLTCLSCLFLFVQVQLHAANRNKMVSQRSSI